MAAVRLTGCQTDVLAALRIGGRILWRAGCRPTLHDPDTGEFVAHFGTSTLLSLYHRGLVAGSSVTKGPGLGIVSLTPEGAALAAELVAVC